MSAGDPTPRYCQLLSTFGSPLAYASAAAFLAAGWALTFKDATTGAALSPQPSWEIAAESAGLHRVLVAAEPSVPWYGVITQAPGGFTPQLVLTGLGEAYSNSDLATLILAAYGTGTAGTVAVTSGRLEDWTEGDVLYRTGLEIPQWALDAVGAADLSAVDAIQAGLKRPFPTAESAAAQASSLTCTATDVPNRIVKLDNAWVPALAVGTGNERVAYKVEIALKKGARRITAARFDMDVVWQAETNS